MTDVIGVSDSHKKQVFGSLLIEIENFYFNDKVIERKGNKDNYYDFIFNKILKAAN